MRLNILLIALICAGLFSLSNTVPIEPSCEPKSEDWFLEECVEVYDGVDACYLPIYCNTANYACPGMCPIHESTITFPCSMRYM